MSKVKTVHFFRHAQAQHNYSAEYNPEPADVRDTSLTAHGIEQAKAILTSAAVTNFKRPTLLISSPLRRCLQTALYGFHLDFNENLHTTLEKNKEFPEGSLSRHQIKKLFKRGEIKFEADPRIMECLGRRDILAHHPTLVADLPEEFRAIFTFPQDLFPAEEDAEWLNREGMYKDYALRRLAQGRVNRFYRYLYDRQEEEIIVVAHKEVLQNYLLPPPWDQPLPNAWGYTFKITWDLTGEKVQKKKRDKEPELLMKMEEIKPSPLKAFKKAHRQYFQEI
jgi:broad specificity phosphatase PhoE